MSTPGGAKGIRHPVPLMSLFKLSLFGSSKYYYGSDGI